MISPEEVRDLSLGALTEQYGTPGLYARTLDTLERTGLSNNELVQNSLHLGLALHADDLRTNGHYIDHLMRVTLRIIEDFGIKDENIIAAAPLHDSFEDHPKDLTLALTGERVLDRQLATEIGKMALARVTNDDVVDIISSVTNPVIKPGEDKIEIYSKHTEQLVLTNPRGRTLKLSDFLDNAAGNHATIGPKQHKLDQKYISQYRIHKIGLFLPDSLITGRHRLKALDLLERGHVRAIGRLAAFNTNEDKSLISTVPKNHQ